MSDLNYGAIKPRLENIIDTPGDLLELFPGNDRDKDIYDSVNFFSSQLKNKIYTLGEDNFSNPNAIHKSQKVPPYPKFNKQFNYIFLNEHYWLWMAEFGKYTAQQVPEQGLTFINDHLKEKGKFIITKSLTFYEAEQIHEHLIDKGNYELFFMDKTDKHVRNNFDSVAVLTKLN